MNIPKPDDNLKIIPFGNNEDYETFYLFKFAISEIAKVNDEFWFEFPFSYE